VFASTPFHYDKKKKNGRRGRGDGDENYARKFIIFFLYLYVGFAEALSCTIKEK
jgi:hypothetical protein